MRSHMKIINQEKGVTGIETAIILIAFVVIAAVFAYTITSAGLFSTEKSQEAIYNGLQSAESTMELRGSVIGYNVGYGTLANGTGVATGAPVTFSSQSDTITVTTTGSFIVTLPPNATGTATSGTSTVQNSPQSLSVGTNTVTTSTIGTFTIALTASGSLGKVDIDVTLFGDGGSVDLTPAYTLVNGTLTQSKPDGNRLQVSFIDSNTTVSDCPWTVTWSGQNDGDNILESNEQAVITVWLHDYDGENWSEGPDPPFLGSDNVDTYHNFTLELKPANGATLTVQRTTPAYLDPVVDLH